MGLINELAFHCWNMARNDGAGVHRLVRSTPLGKVDVMRIGDVVYASTWGVGGGGIILSSAENESYEIRWTLSPGVVSIEDMIAKVQLPATFFSETFVDPNYDMYSETCSFIFTLDHASFIVTINGGNVYQPVTNPRDDWHNNSYNNIADMKVGQHFLTYYESFTNRPGEVHISFSQSPYTYSSELSHIDRYIDHSKRLYIPILGRGEEFESQYLKYSKCEDYPYGKKPFTITADGITTYREVVKAAGVVASPAQLIMQLYWPFIPYMHEIPYLNLQYFSGGIPRQASLQEIGSLRSYELQYNSSEDIVNSLPLRTDVATGNFPADTMDQSDNSTFDFPNDIVSGIRTITSSQTSSSSNNVKKSATLGTIGELKDLFVETELNRASSSSTSRESQVTRVSNFPTIYYLPEFLPSMLMQCCNYADQTTGYDRNNSDDSVIITGGQSLKCGDITIDYGAISMSYSGESSSNVTHDGTSSRTCECPVSKVIHIVYTTQQMSVSEEQQLYAFDADNNVVAGVTWLVISGGGSISGAGLYTAPASNVGCTDNPIIQASYVGVADECCEGFASTDTLQISVNAYSAPCAVAYALLLNQSDVDGYCLTWFNCSGVWLGNACGGSAAACAQHSGWAGHWSEFYYYGRQVEGYYDQRDAGLLAAGCCPAQLL
jgi:hypothetical protein